jgi:Ser/Thr protein kinase RdoA (MazF antagonist)
LTDIWADIPLTDDILEVAEKSFGIDADASPVRLYGGEESASYRLGENVVRIGPTWRTDAELEWCYTIATHASRSVPEALASRRTQEGRCVTRVDDRPVTVWPFVEGVWADKTDPDQRLRAANLLARLHRALRDLRVVARPVDSSPLVATSDLDDADLDGQIAELHQRYRQRQPLHGDFYRGNIIVSGGAFAGLVDWDNAFVGPPEQELAWASWEWSDARQTQDLAPCAEFISAYAGGGGPAGRIDEATLACFVRGRLRWEIAYSRAMRNRGVEVDAEYEAETKEVFFALKRFS